MMAIGTDSRKENEAKEEWLRQRTRDKSKEEKRVCMLIEWMIVVVFLYSRRIRR